MENHSKNVNKNDTQSSLHDGVAKIEKHLRDIRREVSKMVPPVKEFIVKHPVGTFSAVLGIGFLIGCFIAGNPKENHLGD